MSTIKVDTIATRTGSGNITASNTIAGTSATLSGTLGVTGNITASTTMSAVGSFTHGSNTGDTRFELNGPNQYRSLYKHAGNIAGYIGGSGADVLRFSNAAGTTTLEANNGQFTYPLQPSAQSRPAANITDVTGDATTYYSYQGNGSSGTASYTDVFDQNADMSNGTFTAVSYTHLTLPTILLV